MSETTILAVVVGALWGVTLALVGVVWAMLRERITTSESKVATLETQNASQEERIGRLTERMLAREQAHSEHRENMSEQFARLDSSIRELGAKIDRLAGSRTPYPTQYGGGKTGE
jgi:uncharacterized protein HemX